MNTRFIETFVTLARLRSFRATASALHATPGAISLRIKCLEDELGTELVDRHARQFQLTHKGEHLLAHACTVLEAMQRLQAASRCGKPLHGRLRLGVIDTVAHSWLAPCLRELNAHHPQAQVDVSIASSLALARRMRARELDVAILAEGDPHAGVLHEVLARYPMRWVARAGLVQRDPDLAAAQVRDMPLLTFGRGSAPHRRLEQAVSRLPDASDRPRIVCLPSVAMILRLVQDGFGVAILPALLAREQLASGLFEELPPQLALPPMDVSMWIQDETRPLALAAADAVRHACADHGESAAPAK